MKEYRCPKCGSNDLNSQYSGFECNKCFYSSIVDLNFKVLNPKDIKFFLEVGNLYLTRNNNIIKIVDFNEYYIADNGNRYNYKGHDITDNSSNDIASEYE